MVGVKCIQAALCPLSHPRTLSLYGFFSLRVSPGAALQKVTRPVEAWERRHWKARWWWGVGQ